LALETANELLKKYPAQQEAVELKKRIMEARKQ